MSWVQQLARPEILALQAYEPAAWEPCFERLHANELPWRAPADHTLAGLNRYPQPQPAMLVERLASLYEVDRACILIGRGSDEMIDLLVRAFCRAGRDRVLICPPTFAMYAMAARIQGAEPLAVDLRAQAGFALDTQAVIAQCNAGVKLVFLCSPNNPTGQLLEERCVLELARALENRALLVVDEAYVEFSAARSLSRHLADLPHLAILRTLSKAHALAGARCGAVLADPAVIAVLRKLIPPYAIPQLTVDVVLASLAPQQLQVSQQRLDCIRAERERLHRELAMLPAVARVWPSDANFILTRFRRADLALARARAAGLLLRDVRGQRGLDECVRVTVGTPGQNDRLLQALR